MARKKMLPTRSLEILATLKCCPGMDINQLCSLTGTEYSTVQNQLRKLKSYSQVSSRGDIRMEGTSRRTSLGAIIPIPISRKEWEITAAGEKRLAYRGGHKKFCLICKKERKKRR